MAPCPQPRAQGPGAVQRAANPRDSTGPAAIQAEHGPRALVEQVAGLRAVVAGLRRGLPPAPAVRAPARARGGAAAPVPSPPFAAPVPVPVPLPRPLPHGGGDGPVVDLLPVQSGLGLGRLRLLGVLHQAAGAGPPRAPPPALHLDRLHGAVGLAQLPDVGLAPPPGDVVQEQHLVRGLVQLHPRGGAPEVVGLLGLMADLDLTTAVREAGPWGVGRAPF